MLLNELQKPAKSNPELVRENQALQHRIVVLEQKSAKIDAMAVRLQALEQQVRTSQSERVLAAMR